LVVSVAISIQRLRGAILRVSVIDSAIEIPALSREADSLVSAITVV
jgi:hypothetical protein